jgi:PIN domain nuclease of toxin-antitoxin system
VWLADQTRPPGVVVLPITEYVVSESVALPGWVSPAASLDPEGNGYIDPPASALPSSEAIDRFLVVTARQTGAVVVTTDPGILTYAASGAVHAYDARV